MCGEVERVVFPSSGALNGMADTKIEANDGRGEGGRGCRSRDGQAQARNREKIREAARRAVVFGGVSVLESRTEDGNAKGNGRPEEVGEG